MALTNDTNFEDSNVVSKGLNFMNELAATAPEPPLMFQTAVLDVGPSGKRTTIGNKRGWEIYGLVVACGIMITNSISTSQSP
ncbi:hypothetical protein GH714_020202 [Hevea brasiliensis]|uniref:Uncharacterized protein n=1 Tax=Hevea brasiliensis TaxID=3981 RepID=A0A6A6LQC8_HEVBR|nr:hypothetical protein GH714_020202 [Hevea brasiliensis]